VALSDNAARTRAQIAATSMFSRKHRRRGKLPKQASPVSIEKDIRAAIAAMVSREVMRNAFADLMHELPELLTSAARERGDRTDADEGKRARALIAAAKEKLRGSVSTKAIEDMAEKFAERTSTFQRIQLNRQVKSVLGVDPFYGDKGLRNRFANFASESVSLIKGITDDVATRIEKIVTRGLTSAVKHGDLAKTLDNEFGFGERRAAIIARDQIGKLYGQINASRQKDLGVRRFRWMTVGDDRTRGNPSGKYPNVDPDDDHYARDGKIYAYDDPPKDSDGVPQLPGEPILCRCWAEPVLMDLLDDEEE
jgi:SPP1 gp7 family putative phage head morphogenesis protein